MEEIKKKRLKEIISSIGEIRGRHTELVTVYVPAGFNLVKIVDMLRTEQSTAQNIKSKAVRKNVLGALEKILQHLKLYKKTPDNGLVLFCGNASEKEGVADIELWSIEPPEPVKNKLYWCGQNFITDPLKEMVKEREIYGLIVLDRSEAEIGILKGKKVESLKHMESIVPGKTKAGGWCVHEDTLIQLHDGRISKIKDLGENQFICYDMRGLKQRIGKHNHFFSRKSKSALEIKTIAPTEKIIVTPEHKFFFLNEGGIGEKSAGDIKIGDMLLGLRYSIVNGKLELDRDYAQLLGYILGDGDTEKTRITLSEGEQSLAEIYRNLVENSLVLNTSLGERKGKGYWQLRICGKAFVENVKKDFPDIVSTTGKNIPDKICMLKNDYLACFIRGLYDAEGWVDKSTKLIGITMSSIDVIKKLHQLVLRFGIVGSLKPVKMKGSFAKKMRYCLVITDRRSLENFSKFIGFSSKRKRNELNNALSKSRTSWVDQIPLNGRYALSLIRKLNMTTNDFPESRMFFAGTRKMSYCVFEKNILPRMKKKVKKTGVGKDVLDILSNIMSSDLIGIRVKSIKKMKPTGLFYDLEVPQYQSFVANGLVLHNSQARYARIREGLLNDFLKNVGEIASSKFKEYKDLKGVIIGGPGPIKEQFAEGKFLDYAIKNRALGVVNTSYTGEYGLKEMVNLSEDLISQASIIKEKKILDRFFDELGKDSGLAVYGLEKVMKALASGSVDVVLVSEAFEWIKASMECSCGLKEEKDLSAEQIYKEKCPKCGNVLEVKVKKDLIDEIISMAENMGTKVETISVSTSKGEQLKELGAIGGILRFKS